MTIPNLPESIISKIMIMRPAHKLAKIIKIHWKGYVTGYIEKYNTGNHDNDLPATIKAYAFRDIYMANDFVIHINHVMVKLYYYNFVIEEERMKRINYAIDIKDYHEFYANFTIEELNCLGW